MAITFFWIAIMITLTLYGFPITTPTKDVSNLTTLIGGSVIALFISVTILMYSNEQGKESKKIVFDIKNIVVDQKKIMENQARILEDQEEFTMKKRNQAYTGLNVNVFALRHSIRNLEQEFVRFQNGIETKEEYLEQIQKLLPDVKNTMNDVKKYCDANEPYIDEDVMSGIHRLLVEGNVYCEMAKSSREVFEPTSASYPELVNQIWSEIPDPYEGYVKLKNIYGWNV